MEINNVIAQRLYEIGKETLGEKFTRTAKGLPPATIFLILMEMVADGGKSYREVLKEVHHHLGDYLGWGNKEPAKSSLSEGRMGMDEKMCHDIYWAIHEACLRHNTAGSVLWKGLTVYSIDMTTFNTGNWPALHAFFGTPRSTGNKKRPPQGMLTMIIDAGTRMPLTWVIEGYRGSERQSSYELCDTLGLGDLIIGDRGYPSRQFFGQLQDQGAHYLIRVPTGKRGSFREVVEFKNSPQSDSVVTINRKKNTDGEPLRVRLIKFQLPTGQTEVLATNLLDASKYSTQELTSLYPLRWRIETLFREMKEWNNFENIRSHSVLGVYQEMTAIMCRLLLIGELEQVARTAHQETIEQVEDEREENTDCEPLTRPLRIHFNRKDFAESISLMIHSLSQGARRITALIQKIISDAWRHRQWTRPGRFFERISVNPLGKWARNRGH